MTFKKVDQAPISVLSSYSIQGIFTTLLKGRKMSSSQLNPSTKSSVPIHLLDGGLGTTLEINYGCHFTQQTPLWSGQLLIPSFFPTSSSQPGPSVLLDAHKSFVEAGADVLLTATYSASFEGFAKSGFEDREEVEGMMKAAVGITRNALALRKEDGKGRVALSLGAYGAIMSPSQEYAGKYDEEHKTVEQLREWHFDRIGVFMRDLDCWESIEYVAFETLPLIVEVQGVRKCMEGVSKRVESEGRKGKPFWITCVFPGLEEGNKFKLSDGSEVKDVVNAMLGRREGEAVPFGIGLNCTKVAKVEKLVLGFETEVGKLYEEGAIDSWPSLVMYPDGTAKGEVYNTTTKVWEIRNTPGAEGEDETWDEAMSGIVKRTRDRGLWKSIFVGGCCKTTPTEIAKLRKRIDEP